MRHFALLGLLLIAAPAAADPIGITIVQSTYSIDLTARIVDLTTDPFTDLTRARTTVGHDPFSDSLAVTSPLGSHSTAGGSADLFSTVTHTATVQMPGDVTASFAGVAEQIAFTTASDITGDIGLAVSGPFPHTAGSVRLTDLTTNLLLWNYMWDSGVNGNGVSGTIPWASPAATSVAWSVGTSFLVDHAYRLEMSTFTTAHGDSQTVGMTVSGLQPVPEPSTIMLLLFGGVCFVAAAASRHRKQLV
jgi:hypothetical protein